MNCPTDNSIHRKIWDGQILLRISLDSTDWDALASKNASGALPPVPEPLFIHARRCSYFPFIAKDVRKYFVEQCKLSVVADDVEIWYDFLGSPLKWHYPIGVLYDIYTSSPSSSAPSSHPPVPWPVTVHFRDFPATKLIRVHSSGLLDAPHDFFMSTQKEADHLRNGNINKLMALPKEDQSSLWSALVSNNQERFFEVYRHLAGLDSDIPPKHVPLRIYVGSTVVLQEPIAPFDSSAQPITLYQCLQSSLPNMFPSAELESSSNPNEIRSSAVPDVIVHGLKVELTTPLLWLSRHASHSDGFLHMVVCVDDTSRPS
ncbi:autophagy protein Apg5-domain-containing protein [Cladochytrium replicatum]|nr:autophagy protein Apg5-domain-containing protein [Cladochytrium replicatum]